MKNILEISSGIKMCSVLEEVWGWKGVFFKVGFFKFCCVCDFFGEFVICRF